MSLGSREILSFLWTRIRVNKRYLLAAVLFAACNSALNVMLTSLAKPFFDHGLASRDWNRVLLSCAELVLVVFGVGLSAFFYRLFLRVVTERTMRKLRGELFARYLVLSPQQAIGHTSGRAAQHIVNDVFVVSQGLHVLVDVVRAPLMVLGLAAYVIYLNWKLSMFCMVAIPLVAWVGKQLGRSARRNQGRIQQAMENLSNHTIESMRGLRTAQAHGETRRLATEFSEYLDTSYRFLIRLARTEELTGPLTKVVMSVFGATVIAFGAYLVVSGQLTLGALMSFLFAAAAMQQPMEQLNNVSVRTQTVLAAAERLSALLSEGLDPISHAQQRILMAHDGAVPQLRNSPTLHIDKVSFAYDQNLALKDVSLSLAPGERVALVGRSGSGKSTLTLLALRMLDPAQGRVCLDARDARDWDLHAYRAHFAYVSQDVFLFNRSVRDNMLFGRPDATDAHIWSALERANAHNVVERLPQGLDTPLGEHAQRLSGGEKQRLGIARALLRDAPILILDEATSQLDAHNERAVQAAVAELLKGRSALLIAHRLSTVRDATQVLVFDEGSIIERGTPQSLLDQQNGAFSRMWDAQHRS